jgi:hypothetical protein
LLEKIDKVLGSFLEFKVDFSKFKTANGILKAYKIIQLNKKKRFKKTKLLNLVSTMM